MCRPVSRLEARRTRDERKSRLLVWILGLDRQVFLMDCPLLACCHLALSQALQTLYPILLCYLNFSK